MSRCGASSETVMTKPQNITLFHRNVHAFNIDPSSEQLFLEIAATVGGIFLFALVLAWAREATKGISLPFFLHAGWNAVVTAALFLGPESLL